MHRLIDFVNNRAILLNCDTGDISSIKHTDLVLELKSGSCNIDNVKLTTDNDYITCSSGSLHRAETMPKVATIIEVEEHKDSQDNMYKIYTCIRDGFNTERKVVDRKYIERLAANRLLFNGYLRNGEVSIRGPVIKTKVKE